MLCYSKAFSTIRKLCIIPVDNIALVAILNKNTLKPKRVMQWVHTIFLYAMVDNTFFKARHISGYNSIDDSISHKQWTRFRSLAPEADIHSLPISGDFTRMILELK